MQREAQNQRRPRDKRLWVSALSLIFILGSCSSASQPANSDATNQTAPAESQDVTIGAEPIELSVAGGAESSALLYDGGGTEAVVLVHEMGATMESWEDFAETLQRNAVTSIAVSSSTPDSVIAAIDVLVANGSTTITLIGASIGGGVVMQVANRDIAEQVTKVVLLSPANGPAITSGEIEKLMISTEGDTLVYRASMGYEEWADPKIWLEYDGIEHGQTLLAGDHSETVETEILEFLDVG